MNVRSGTFPVLLLLVGLTSVPASAAQPWISVPSTADSSGKVLISGGNLVPSGMAVVTVSSPDGTRVEQARTVKRDGSFTLEYFPTARGQHSVVVRDLGGRKIGHGSFIHMR